MKEYIDAKCNVFSEYFDVPDDIGKELDILFGEMHALGDQCSDYHEFEEKFNSTGLSERYNSFFSKCTPKPVQMTQEQKKEALKMAKENISAKDIMRDAADMAVTELKQEAISMRRKKMIEDGVFDDYTRASNKIEDAARAGKFLFNKFKKK